MELIQTVTDIFTNEEINQSSYNIPDYQRGYKWTDTDVKLLLDDIDKFNVSDGTFYCIQNITICRDKEYNYYNVIDGQQRLTTLYIILCWIGKKDIVEGKLKYSIRKSTDSFLTKYVLTREVWGENFKHRAEHMDEWYVMQAAFAVKNWYNEKHWEINDQSQERISFEDKVLHHTNLIVNELTSSDGEEHRTFANINSVKVPLDGADLVRALLITRSVDRYFNTTSDLHQIRQYRIRMGIEIDSMSDWFKKDDVYDFFNRMLPTHITKKAKTHNFDNTKHKIDILYLLYFIAFSTDYEKEVPSVRFFESTSDYREIRSFFNVLRDWFEDREIYHYLGFLFANCRQSVSFRKMFSLWEQSSSRADFINNIKDETRNALVEPYKKVEGHDGALPYKDAAQRLIESVSNVTVNWYQEKPDSARVLLAFRDVLLALNSPKKDERIPVAYLCRNDEDLEHIGCQNPCPETKENKQYWIDALSSLPTIPQEQQENVNKLIQEVEKVDTINDVLFSRIQNLYTTMGFNSIGNLVLLNGTINKGYHNKPFSQKRIAIINNYFNYNKKEDVSRDLLARCKYIRPWTLNVFIGSGKQEWNTEDIGNTVIDIASAFRKFLVVE